MTTFHPMFPLKLRKRVPGFRATAMGHLFAGLGIGTDYLAVFVPLYAPFTGTLLLFNEKTGGKWIRLTRPNGDRIEFAHLHHYTVKQGAKVRTGQQIAVTGNSGSITSGPHLHIQVFVNGKRVDPEKYEWNDEYDVAGLFERIWNRKAAKGELAYFAKRQANGTILTVDKLKEVMAYWYSIVYPNDVYSTEGDDKWQQEKRKILGL